MSHLDRAITLQKEVEQKLPDFARMVRDSSSDMVVMHQDAFAADYQEEEYRLLGMAVKYAGIMGKQITFRGRHRETLGKLSS